MSQEARGRDLFIVDNSISGWTGLRYLEEWCGIAKAFDIATGFFEIGALLALDGNWQPLKKIRILEIGRVGWSDGTVWLNAGKTDARRGQRATKPGTVGFHGVPEAVWNFHIGGYQVCHKWLKDRKGRTLSGEDIAHYQKIVVALDETIRLMQEIDEVIKQHGGWPGAFVTSAEDNE